MHVRGEGGYACKGEEGGYACKGRGRRVVCM